MEHEKMFKMNQPSKLVSFRSLTPLFALVGLLNLSTFSALATHRIDETDPLLTPSIQYGNPTVSQINQTRNVVPDIIEEEGSEEEDENNHPPIRRSMAPSGSRQKETPPQNVNSPVQNTVSSLTPLTNGMTLTLNHVTVPAEPEQENPFIIQQIGLRSATLQIIEVATLQEKKQVKITTESGLVKTTLEEPGDIRNGLFILFESLRRPHRYYGRFYIFEDTRYEQNETIFLRENQGKSDVVEALFPSVPGVEIMLRGTLLTMTKPNKLFLSCEELDTRCGGRVSDFFGKIYSKIEQDPLGALSLIAGGASRIAKAVATQGASEMQNLLS